jgi:multisubunit Na+/H+ antiporter MnhG subunit
MDVLQRLHTPSKKTVVGISEISLVILIQKNRKKTLLQPKF